MFTKKFPMGSGRSGDFLRSPFLAPLFGLAISLLLGQLATAHAGAIEGVIFSEHGPVKNATVYAYLNYEDLAAGLDFRKSEPGTRDGQYSLTLPPGIYYLTARAEVEGRRLFSYHGVNPITVTDNYRWLPFLMVEENTANCQKVQEQNSLSGRVLYKGQPVSGGVVSIYPWKDRKFRGMGLLTNTLGEDGDFSFALEPGTYVVVARKKQDLKGIGPVRQGDMFCYPSSNPISLTNNQSCDTDINCYPRDDLSLFLDAEVANPQGRRHESRRQSSLSDLQPAEAQKPPGPIRPTTISGRVTDPTGNHLAGLIVTAYPANGLELFQMHALRLITGSMGQTDSDGRYRIALRDGEVKYYIIAREKVGEAPDRSEYFGLYEGSANHSVDVEPGSELIDINVVVDRIMPRQAPDNGHDKR